MKINQLKLNKVCQKNQIILVYLFGSEARNEAHQESDVDIGILFDKKVNKEDYLIREGKLIDFFSGIYLKKEINIVNLNISSPLLKQNVILEGKLLYKKSNLERIYFQINTLQEYDEYSHLNNIYNEVLNLKLKTL